MYFCNGDDLLVLQNGFIVFMSVDMFCIMIDDLFFVFNYDLIFGFYLFFLSFIFWFDIFKVLLLGSFVEDKVDFVNKLCFVDNF